MTDNCCTHTIPHDDRMGPKLLFCIVLNLVFVAAQVYYGIKAESLALLADAGHNLGDVLGLILAGIAAWLGTMRPMKGYTFGLQSATILATLANAVLLLIAVFEITHEAVERLIEGVATPHNGIVMAVAAVAVLVNGFTAWMLHGGKEHDLNIRGMYLHLLADAGVSVGVIVGALLIELTGLAWIDPVVSLMVAAVILFGTWNLLRRTLRLALQGVPTHIKVAEVEKILRSQPGVKDVHDLHIWALGTQRTALSAHLVMPEGHPGDNVIEGISKQLEVAGVDHSTLQIELGACGKGCECHK